MFVALREIRAAKGRFGLMVGVVALITFLLVVLTALTDGLGRQSTSAVLGLRADRVVLSSGDPRPSYSESAIDERTMAAYAALPGVRVEPLVIGQGRLEGTSTTSAAVFGMAPNGREAQSLPPVRAGEVLLDAHTQGVLGLHEGSTVRLNGQELRVGRTMPEQWFSHQRVAVTTDADARRVAALPAGAVASALLLQSDSSDPDLSAVTSRTRTVAMTPQESLSALAAYQAERGSLTMIQGFLYAISALVVVAFVSVWTIQRTGELAVLRALGASRRHVLRDALGQAAVVLLLGVALGALAGLVTALAIGDKAPLLVGAQTLLRPVLGVAVLGLAGSFLSTRRVTRVDPMLALGGN